MLTNCRELRSRLTELARENNIGATERRMLMLHAGDCHECARHLEEQEALTAAMRQLASEGISDAVQFAAAMAEFDRVHGVRRLFRKPVLLWAAGVGLAAAACVGVEWTQKPAARLSATPAVSAQKPLPSAAPSPVSVALPAEPLVKRGRYAPGSHRPGDDTQPFIPIPYTVALAPEERTAVLRMNVPVTALIAAGFPVHVADLTTVVQADVLVSQDGRARAIRPISILATH